MITRYTFIKKMTICSILFMLSIYLYDFFVWLKQMGYTTWCNYVTVYYLLVELWEEIWIPMAVTFIQKQ